MVGFPKDVEEVYLGENGILANAPAGALVIDMTTTSPALWQRIAKLAREKGLRPLDAPVSGGFRRPERHPGHHGGRRGSGLPGGLSPV